MGKELSVSVASLRAAYPNAELQPATVAVYTAALAKYDPALVQQAVGSLLLTSRFIPSIAEIVEAVAEQALELPSVAEAWAEAEGRSMGSWPYDKHLLVTQALNLIGGPWHIRTSEAPSVVRSQFRDLYTGLRRDKLDGYIHDRPEREMRPEREDNAFHIPVPQLRAMP